MENKKKFELEDDVLNGVSAGTGDPFHFQSCTDFRCYSCGYQKTDPEEWDHLCEPYDIERHNRCDNCGNIDNCIHGHTFMILYLESQ